MEVMELNVTQFYTNFSSEELQFDMEEFCHPASENANSSMFLTPSPSVTSQEPFSPSISEEDEMTGHQGHPYLRIVEQPVSKFRFRYRSEMQGAHGSLLGQKDTSKKRTHPTVQLVNFDGDAYISCSLYTAEEPFIPHIHQLIARGNAKEELDHEIVVSERNNYRAEFKGLGIVHMSKKDLKKELIRKKENMYLETMRNHSDFAGVKEEVLRKALKHERARLEKEATGEAKNMDANKVRLCFRAYVRGTHGQVIPLCDNVFSETIQNMKSAETGEVKICRIDKCAGSCQGGDEIFILVEKVCKKNIKVRFFEIDDQEQEIWSDYGQFSDFDVHHQYAIVFRTPKYKSTAITDSVQVKIELVRIKDDARSDPLSFTYKPIRKQAIKRPYTTQWSSSSFSSSEGPKRYMQRGLLSSEDPMLSESEKSVTSSFNSLSFSSDAIAQAVKALDNGDNAFDEFAKFINSSDFSGYSQSFVEGGGISDHPDDLPRPQMDTTYSIHQCSDPETFMDLDPLPWKSNLPMELNSGGLPSKIRLPFGNIDAEGDITTDGADPKKRSMPSGSLTAEYWKQKESTLNYAKVTYGKLLSLMKSRHPSRLQDMKNIITAEDRHFGPLHAAVMHGQLKELSDLLSVVIKSNQLELINCSNYRKQTPLMVAVEENNVECLKLLCIARANLNHADHKDNTALHIAVKTGHFKCLKVLLSVKPTRDSIPLSLNKHNEKGETALHLAVMQKDLQSVKLLVTAGADLNVQNGTAGNTPLHLAVEFDSEEIVKYLLCQGKLNPNKFNFCGKTALDIVRPEKKEILVLLDKSSEAGVEERHHQDHAHRAECEDGVDHNMIDDDDTDHDDTDRDDTDHDDTDHDDTDHDDTDHDEEEEEEDDRNDKDENSIEDQEDDDSNEKDEENCVDQEQEDIKDDGDYVESGCSRSSNKKRDVKSKGSSSSVAGGDFSLVDLTTLEIIASNLDKSKKWKTLCQRLNCSFLIQTFSTVPSPSRCLINYLDFDKQLTLAEFRDALVTLDVPDAVKALDKVMSAARS